MTVAVHAESSLELITHGLEGYLVPDADAPFAEAVLTCLRNPEQRRAMGHAARVRAETLSARRCTEDLVEIYQRVIHEAPPPPRRSPNWERLQRQLRVHVNAGLREMGIKK